MPKEIEAKFKVDDFRSVRRALRDAGATLLCKVLQTDLYFDTPDQQLLHSDTAVRLRNTRKLPGTKAIDARPLLTIKGPASRNAKVKVRKEVQSRLDDAGVIVDVLGACGFAATFTIQKRRESYRLGPCQIELDELPLAGRFVEIEAPGARQIERVRRQLGLQVPPSKEHYINIAREACRKLGLQCNSITFDACRACKRAKA